MGNITANMYGSLTYTLALARRWSIYFLYEHVLGSPPENKWTGRSGTITSIRHILSIPVGSKDCVRKVLSDVCAADTAVVEYDPTADMAHGGVPKIVGGSEQARIVSDAMASGVGIGQAAVLVNAFRARLNATLGEIDPDALELKPISWRAVRGFVERSAAFDLHKRGTKKSGKNDEGTHTLVVSCLSTLTFDCLRDRIRLGDRPARTVRADLQTALSDRSQNHAARCADAACLARDRVVG